MSGLPFDPIAALMNWFWQGSVLTLLVAIGLRCGGRLNAATRERIWWMTAAAVLLLALAAPISALAWFSTAEIPSPLTASVPLVAVPPAPDGTLRIVAAAWSCWLAIALTQLAVGVWRIRAMTQAAAPLPATRQAALLRSIGARDGELRIAASDAVGHAAVLGFRRPVVALSPALLERLTEDELLLVLAHEYAHVRRRDPLANLVQRTLRAVAGIHPAIWWIDRSLTLEREVACDDWVVAWRSDARSYASCLVKLAGNTRPGRLTLAPGALVSQRQLTRRVLHLLDDGGNRSPRGSRPGMALALPAIAAAAMACGATDLIGTVSIPALPDAPRALGRALTARVAAPPATSVAPRPASVAPADEAPIARPSALRGSPSPPSARLQAAAPAPVHVSVPTLLPVEAPRAGDWDVAPAALPAESVAAAVIVPDAAAVPAGPVLPARGLAAAAPWKGIADAGIALGNTSRDAAVSTAGVFTRLGKSFRSGA